MKQNQLIFNKSLLWLQEELEPQMYEDLLNKGFHIYFSYPAPVIVYSLSQEPDTGLFNIFVI